MKSKIDADAVKKEVDKIMGELKQVHNINLWLDTQTFTLLHVLSNCTNINISNVISKSLHIYATLTLEEQKEFIKRPLTMGVGQPAELLKALQQMIDEDTNKEA